MRKVAALSVVLMPYFVAPVFSAPIVKRLLILNPVNEGAEDNAYIGASLAETLRTRLAETYFFMHPPPEAIETTQKDNLIQNEDLHTKSAALQMGAWLRQDLVLAGKYSVVGNRLKLHLTLYEIDGEKIALQFKTETVLSAKMFDSFSRIADELGEKMKSALPSQQDLSAAGGSYYDPEKGKRTVLLSFGARALGFSKTTTNLTGETTLSNAEFPHLNAELTYQRHHAGEIFNRRYKWPVFLQFSLNGGYAKKDYARDGFNVPTRIISAEALPAVGYVFSLAFIRLEPYLGVGLGYANFYFDYSALTRKPVDTTVAQSVSTQTIEQYYFFTQVGFTTKYAITPRWAVVLIPSVTMFHFTGGIQAELNARLGVGWYF
ncbi:MAG: hypothetical protein JNJ69_18400 [Leptospiraceae bacterium]|nr:hypothetical protein [Leptospiraceae bacterium]